MCLCARSITGVPQMDCLTLSIESPNTLTAAINHFDGAYINYIDYFRVVDLPRYKVVEGSSSNHCCFEFTVIDTQLLVSTGFGVGVDGITHGPKVMCECFEQEQAETICRALNLANSFFTSN